MAFRQRAKITADLEFFGDSYQVSKYFIGTENEVYAEANDWTYSIALQFIEDNAIEDEYEQELVIANAYHIIEWENDEPIMMYAVFESEIMSPIYGVYPTLADAEEAIFCECENWVYEVLMNESPYDFFGEDEWIYPIDWKFLMKDCGETFTIQEIPVFGVGVIE